MREKQTKFLIVQFKQIGDVVLTTPLARLIKENLPFSIVDFLTFPVNEPLLRNNPHIDNIITVKKKGFLNFFKWLITIRQNGYDVILDSQNTPRSLYFVIFSGARHKVTYSESSRRFFYSDLVCRNGCYPSSIRSNLLTPFIAHLDPQNMTPPKPEIYYSDEEKKVIDGLMAQSGIKPHDFIVILAPSHRRATRRWPIEFYAETASHLISVYNAKVVVSWGPGEEDYILSHPFFRRKDNPSLVVDWNLNLLQLAALLDRAHLLIGNCSAPHHLATSQNTPTFIIFGSTSFGWCYPSEQHHGIMKKLECQPCNKVRCQFGNSIPCLKSFTFSDIRKELDSFISEQVLPLRRRVKQSAIG